MICAARRSKRHGTYERLQCKLSVSRAAARGRATGPAAEIKQRGRAPPAGRGDHAERRCAAGAVRAARAPRVVPTGHGAGAGRRASRSSRARPGTRAALFVQGTSTLHNTSRRRDARYGLHDTARSQGSPAPIRTKIRIGFIGARRAAPRRATEVHTRPTPRGPRANDVTKVESKESKRTAHKTMNRTNIAISRGSSPTPDPRNDATMLRRLHP